RFILVDNGSNDPLVPTVVKGFERRGMFAAVDWEHENSAHRHELMVEKDYDLVGEYFVWVESDVAIYDSDPCWLSRMAAHMDNHPDLFLLGSYIDGRDFANPDHAMRISPEMDPAVRADLIKAHSPERMLPIAPPSDPIIDPFNPPGRL